VLTEASLKKLDEEFGRFGDKVTYRVDCVDELRREFDLKKLLAYDNAPKKAIRAIAIGVDKENDFSRCATMRLRQSPFLAAINLSVSGPESEVEKLNDAIKSILAGMRPWYWWLAKYSILLVVAGLYLALYFLLLAVLLIMRLTGRIGPIKDEGAESWGFIFGAWIVVFAVLGALDCIKSKLFPRATFAIGQGLNRYQVLEKIRWTVVIGLSVGLAANVAVLFVR
jgi:hypothetical protein